MLQKRVEVVIRLGAVFLAEGRDFIGIRSVDCSDLELRESPELPVRASR